MKIEELHTYHIENRRRRCGVARWKTRRRMESIEGSSSEGIGVGGWWLVRKCKVRGGGSFNFFVDFSKLLCVLES